jgi:hypothetical protein
MVPVCRGFDSTIIDRSSQQAQGNRRRSHWEKATRNENGGLAQYGRLSQITIVSNDPFDAAERAIHVEKAKSERKVMQIHSVGI